MAIGVPAASGDLDPDGYTLSVDGAPSTAVGINGTVAACPWDY